MNELLHTTDNILIEHIRDGVVIRTDTYHNLVTNAGFAGISSRLGASSTAIFNYIAIGIGTTAAAVTDTTLQSEITTNGGQRAAATVTQVTTTIANDTTQLDYTFVFTGSFSVSETGVLNAASGGTLLNRKVFTAYPVISGDRLRILHQFKFSA